MMDMLHGVRYFSRDELSNSPSRRDGLTAEKEEDWRRQYVKVITEAGIRLRIPQWAIYVSILMCHQYFAVRSMLKSERFLVAAACLFLGAKIEENPRHLRDVASTCLQLVAAKRQKVEPSNGPQPWEDKAQLDAYKEQILVAERAVLYALDFTLDLSHPYRSLLAFQRQYEQYPFKQDLVHTAWMLINDSTRTDISLRYPPDKLAAAMLWVAAVLLEIQLPEVDGQTFYEAFKLTYAELTDIFESVVGRYTVIATREAAKSGRILDSPDSESTRVLMATTTDAGGSAPNRTLPNSTPMYPPMAEASTSGVAGNGGTVAGQGQPAMLVRSAGPGKGVQAIFQPGHAPTVLLGIKAEPGSGGEAAAAGAPGSRKRPAEGEAGPSAQRPKVEVKPESQA